MARIFKPRYAVRRMVTGPDGTKRYAPVLDKQGKPVYRETANWYIETRVSGRLKKVPGYTDKAATLQLAAKLVKQEAHRNQGLIPEGTESLTLPLEQHLADWLEALKSEASEAHARQQHTRAKRVIDGCGFDLWRDIRREKVAQYLARIQLDADGKAGLSRRTADFYLQAVKQFLGWLVESERAPFSPLANVRRKKKSKRAKYILRHPRRPFSDDELRQLIAVTKTGPELYGMTGAKRAILYRLVAETGLRQNEARTLTPEVFFLDGDNPEVTVKAGYSKNGEEADLPIRRSLADDLRPFVEATKPGCQVFPIPTNRKTAIIVFRRDLERARDAWLEQLPEGKARTEGERSDFLKYRNRAGEFADFHSLRHTFISNLARAGVAPKVAMDLARHSNINLTMAVYSHTVRSQRSQAIEVLPELETRPAAATDVA